jgi:hypothetical protein
MTSAISGNSAYHWLFVKSSAVAIKNLNLSYGLAQGGKSANGGADSGRSLFVVATSMTLILI